MLNRSEISPVEDLGGLLEECTVNDHVELSPLRQDDEQQGHADNVDLSSVVVSGSRSLVEALCSSRGSGSKITSLQARDCGIAFLATDANISSALQFSIRHVRRLSFHADLVSNDTFTWDGSKLAVPCFEHRQQKLQRAITSGLLGTFISSAKDLEELNIDLQCHEISSLQVEESDLVNFLGNYRWSQLRSLKLRGIWTSEGQLLDLLGRHQGSLKYLDIGNVVLKEGTWRSFFEKLKMLVVGSLISAERFQLGGECLASRMENTFQGRCWELNSLALPDKSLRDSLVDFIFSGGAFPFLDETDYYN